jgi:hypothetical protein
MNLGSGHVRGSFREPQTYTVFITHTVEILLRHQSEPRTYTDSPIRALSGALIAPDVPFAKLPKFQSEPRSCPVKAIFVITLKSNFHPILCRALSGATKWAPDVPWAEIRALQKLLAPRLEKSKIQHEFDLKKKKKPAPDGVAMSELSNGTKNHPFKCKQKNPEPEKEAWVDLKTWSDAGFWIWIHNTAINMRFTENSYSIINIIFHESCKRKLGF